MEDYRLDQSGQEVQNILDGAAMQVDLTAETERAELAEQTLQGNIDIEERDRKAADLTLQGNIDAEEIRAKAAEKQNADDIDALEEKVPSGASASNKLATESYVDDSVATATATFRGTYNLVSDLHLTVDATEQQIATALALAITTADNNDYCFVQVPTSSETPTEIKEIDRYKFNGTAWSFEYKLNNSGFTAAQWAAINSGITSGDVTKLAALPTNAELTTLLNGKQDVLTFDNVPTEGSSRPVKSGGVYSAIDDEKTARETADSSLSSAIEAILLLIPSAATSLNKLADKAFVNSSIATASATFRGTYNLVTDLSLTVSANHAQIATALAGAVSDEDNNDYAFVQIPTSDATPTQIAKTERYKFNGTAWEYEYDLNNSGYTAVQWAAINSGITEALVTKLSALPTNAELTSALGVLTSSITTINQKIPSAASQANQLVDTAAMEAYIVQVLDVLTASFNVTSTDGHVTVQISQVDGKITSVAVSTSDIASAASLSLIAGRVTTAEGNISTNAADIANLQAAYVALTQSDIVVVEGALPSTGQQQNIIYRQPDQDHTPPQFYSDYMWNGTAWVLMATYNNAIDPRPKKGSQNLVTSGGVFDNMGALDISELNATENPHTLATYADLSAALAAIPSDYQKGGMSIKFVQTSDNKYVQYRLMSDSFNTTSANWQGIDDEPTPYSENLVTSGGVYAKVGDVQKDIAITSAEELSGIVSDGEKFVKAEGDYNSYITFITKGQTVSLFSGDVVGVNLYSNRPELNIVNNPFATLTEYEFRLGYTAPSDCYAEIIFRISSGINATIRLGISGLYKEIDDTNKRLIAESERLENQSEQDDTYIRKDTDIIKQEVGFTRLFTSDEFSSIIFDSGSSKFVQSSGSWQCFIIPLTPGIRYNITSNNGTFITFNLRPKLNESATVQHTYNSGVSFTAQANDKYLEVYGNIDSGFSTMTLVIEGELREEVKKIKEEIGGPASEQTFTQDDFDNIIWDSGSGEFFDTQSIGSSYNSFVIHLEKNQFFSFVNLLGDYRTAKVFLNKPVVGEIQQPITEYIPNNIYLASQDCYVNIIYYIDEISTTSVKINVSASGIYAEFDNFKGYKIAGFGDSIMHYYNHSPITFIGGYSQASVYNCGFGGTRWNPRMSRAASFPTTEAEAFNCLDVQNLIKAWVANDFTNIDEAFDIISQVYSTDTALIASFAESINNLKSIRPSEIDIFIFMCGVNDLQGGVNIGNADDVNYTTLCGAINSVVTDIYSANQSAKIYFYGNIVKWWNRPDPSGFSDVWKNGDNLSMADINTTIKNMALKYKLPFCDLYNTLGWNMQNFAAYFGPTENSHPVLAYNILGRKMYEFMKANRIF